MPNASVLVVDPKEDKMPNASVLLVDPKKDKMPDGWLAEKNPDPASHLAYRQRHDLGEVPHSIPEFEDFYEARKERMAARIRDLLGVEPSPAEEATG